MARRPFRRGTEHRREYELTKNVSLLQIDPLALVQLRATVRDRIGGQGDEQ